MSPTCAHDPFAFGGRQDDAALIDAEAEMRRLLDEGRDLDEDDAELTRRWDRINECTAFINTTMPATLAGCAAKLRYLTHFEIGMAAGDRDDDCVSVQQILAFIEDLLALERGKATT